MAGHPYFVPGEAARMALTSAALGGLDVRLLVPRVSDSRLVTYAARSYFDELLEAGVRIYEYGPRMLHTKALLADDDVCIVGSAISTAAASGSISNCRCCSATRRWRQRWPG